MKIFYRMAPYVVEAYFGIDADTRVVTPGWRKLAARLLGRRSLLDNLADKAISLALEHRAELYGWSARLPDGFVEKCAELGIPLTRVEDGFIRSAGLGVLRTVPYSLVADKTGIYYDPSAPSDLETILETRDFPPALLARAADLRRYINDKNVTKYNLAESADWPATPRPAILVPGQVDDDASVRKGGCGIHSNLELLQAVRAAHPDAFIIYKPHPDVELAGRHGKIPNEIALRHCDRIASRIAITSLYPVVDEVHTLTSLSGFEALLRGLPVHVYGGPFYAGWGLTTDRVAFPRRTRRLTVEELVAGALILYPRYYDWDTRRPCQPEDILPNLRRPSPVVI